jgi:Na+-translocating ferredoxin:NAD+ oxidoreductase RnfE subunit
MNKITLLKNGIIKENPVLILLLGTCPTLAVTTTAINGLGMGSFHHGGFNMFEYSNIDFKKYYSR